MDGWINTYIKLKNTAPSFVAGPLSNVLASPVLLRCLCLSFSSLRRCFPPNYPAFLAKRCWGAGKGHRDMSFPQPQPGEWKGFSPGAEGIPGATRLDEDPSCKVGEGKPHGKVSIPPATPHPQAPDAGPCCCWLNVQTPPDARMLPWPSSARRGPVSEISH